jgi:NitT/TauT family transport system substrate-binding protein
MNPQRICKVAIGIAVVLILSVAALMPSASAADNVSLRLDWKLTGYQLPFYWAKAKGYYEKENLSVDIKQGAGSGKTVNLIGGGQDDIGLADYMLMAVAASKGMPVKGIMGVVQDGAWAVISYADKPIKTPQDLIGKSIAMTADHKALFDLLLSVNKIPEDKVSIKVVSPATRNTVFANGNVDGFVSIIIGSPIDLVVRAKHNEGKPVYFMPFAKFGVSPLGQGLIATDQTIAQKSDLLARFVRATVHGFEDVMKKDNYDAAVENGLKLSGTTEKQRESIKLQLLESVSRFHTDNTEGKPFGWMSDKDWDKSIDILLKTKKIDKPFPASNLYTNKFVPQH